MSKAKKMNTWCRKPDCKRYPSNWLKSIVICSSCKHLVPQDNYIPSKK